MPQNGTDRMLNEKSKHIQGPPVNVYSKIRQNYHEECEASINKQINMEFYASYVYLSMPSYFNRDDQALHGIASFPEKNSNEERKHGMKLMNTNQNLISLFKLSQRDLSE